MAENDEEIVSMVDVLEEGKQMEEEAAAVLGDSDDKCCTYLQGYMNRQALYACMTCRETNKTLAGICLACSYECHEGHEFVELYTKRNFRCDCGNTKFPNMNCKLFKNKRGENAENVYNHNFAGLYCICDRPYPDPEDEIEDEMIQCVVCEDWFHGRHLGAKNAPESGDYQEMVCLACMKLNEFLWYYAVHSQETKVVKEEPCEEVDVVSHRSDEATSSPSSSSAVAASGDPMGSSSSGIPQAHSPVSLQTSDATNSIKSTAAEVAHGNDEPLSSSAVSAAGDAPDSASSGIPQGHSPVPHQTSDATISSTSAATEVTSDGADETVLTSVQATVGPAGDCTSSLTNSGNTTKQEVKPEGLVSRNDGEVVETASLAAAATEQKPVKEESTPSSSPHATLHNASGESSIPAESSEPATPRQEGQNYSAVPAVAVDSKPGEAEGSAFGCSEPGSTVASIENAGEGDCKVQCRLRELQKREVQRSEGAVFWPWGWRTKLCACSDCKAMYTNLRVSFLQDPSDTVAEYEERGKEKRQSLYGQGMEALSSMNRVQQVEMLHEYADMKSALSEFLKSFADQGKVVTASDIQEFYEGLSRKRQRVGSASAVQYLCR